MDWRELGTRFRHGAGPGNGISAPFCEAVTAKKWWLIGPPLAALLLAAALVFLQPPRYCAESQVLIGPRTAGLIGLRSSLALMAAGAAQPLPSGARHRLAQYPPAAPLGVSGKSKQPEFDSMTQSLLRPLSRALIFLGFMRDPARQT